MLVGAQMLSATMITTDGNAIMDGIHNRMPVMLSEENIPAWLGEEPTPPEKAKQLLLPFPPERMSSWPVSKAVGSVKSQDATLADEVKETTPSD